VWIQRYRIGTIETAEEVRDVGVEDTERAIGPVHMQPETVLGAEVGQLVERVHCAGIDGSGTGHHTERSKTCLLIGSDRFAQCVQIHFVALIDRDDTWLSQSQEMR